MTTERVPEKLFSEAGILIVDDESDVLNLLAAICEAAGFKKVFTAQNGFDALKLLERHIGEIDLLSLDLVMPGMDVLTRGKSGLGCQYESAGRMS